MSEVKRFKVPFREEDLSLSIRQVVLAVDHDRVVAEKDAELADQAAAVGRDLLSAEETIAAQAKLSDRLWLWINRLSATGELYERISADVIALEEADLEAQSE